MTDNEYDRAFIRAMFHALLLMLRHRLAPPLAIGWRAYSAPPTLTVQVHPDQFKRWYELLDVPVSHSEEHDGQLHITVEGRFPGCDCQHVHVVTVQAMPDSAVGAAR